MPIVDPWEKPEIVDPWEVRPEKSQITSGFVGGDVPLMEHTPEESEAFGRGALETGGMFAGGIGGSLIAPGPGTIAGETAGFTGARKLGDLLYGPREGASLAKDVGTGLAYSLVPRGVAAGLGKVAEKAGFGAIRSALKVPPTQAKSKTVNRAIETMISEDLGLSERGIVKAINKIGDLDTGIEQALSDAASGGAAVDVSKLTQVLDSLKPRFKYRANPNAYYDVIEQVKAEIVNHPSVTNGKIPLSEAHQLKKGLYQELDSFYQNIQSLSPKKIGEAQAESVAKAAWANAIKEEILKDPSVPAAVTKKLQSESALMNAKRWIQRRANVAANMDPITFNDVLLGSLVGEGIPTAVAVRVLRMPRIQARIGIYLTKAGRGGQKAAKSVALGPSVPAAVNLLDR